MSTLKKELANELEALILRVGSSQPLTTDEAASVAEAAAQLRKPTAFDIMLNRQEALMTILGVDPKPVDDILKSPVFKDVLIMMAGEVAEALQPLTVATKPWKQLEADALRENCREEVVDVFFFYLEAMILMGMDERQLVDAYVEKCNKNIVRAAGRLNDATTVAVQAVTPNGDVAFGFEE